MHKLLLLGVFIAIGIYVIDNLEQIKSQEIYLIPGFLVCGLLLTILGHLGGYFVWTRIAASFEMCSSWRHAGKAWFLSRLGRYLPGKVAILLLRFGAYPGHSKTKVSAATIVEMYSALCATSMLLLLLAQSSTSAATPSILSIAILICILLALSDPRVMRFALRIAAKWISLPTLHALPRWLDMLGFSAAHLVTMFVHGGALFMAFNAVGQVQAELYLLTTAAFFVSSLIGMLAVFAPSGIGVREAALIAMLSPYIDAKTLLIGVVLIRILGIISELLLSGFFIALDRFHPSGAEKV